MLWRVLKIALSLIGALVLLVLAVSISLHVLISRQDHQFIKDQVSSRISEATGYTLDINGALELPYALLPTIVLHDIVLDSGTPIDDSPLLTADSLRITIAVLPLLKDRVRIDDTTLSNATLHLEFDAAGQPNWIPETRPERGESEYAVDVHAINFEQFDIRLIDRRIDVELGARIAEFRARIAELRLDAPAEETYVDVELVAEFEDLPIRAEGRIRARDNAFAGLELPVSLTGTILDMAFALDGHIDRVVGAPIDELGFFANLHLKGSNMDAFSDVTGLPLPTTTSFVIDGAVEGRPGSIVANDVDGTLYRDGMKLAAKGRIGQLTSFDELDLAATLEGDDLEGLPYLPPEWLRATDSFLISADVRGDWPALSLDNVVSSAKRDDITVTATGRLADASTFGNASLEITIDGNNINNLAMLFDNSSSDTRSYSWSGRVIGSWPQLSIEDTEFDVERDDLKARITGGYLDIINSPVMDVRIEASGADAAVIPEFQFLELPTTEEFSIDSRLRGSPDSVAASGVTLIARRGSHRLTASGTVGDVNTFSDVNLAVSASGADLYELNDVLAPDFPHTERYELTGRLTGNAEDLSAHDLELAGSVPGLDLEFGGDIGKIVELRDVDVRGRVMIDNPSELAEWSGINLPPDLEIELSGRMAGTAPNFDLSDLTYRSGETLIYGSAGMVVGDKLSFTGAVTSGQLDLQPFFSTHDEKPVDNGGVEKEELFSDEPLDFGWLDAVDIDFSLDDLELVREGENTQIPKAHIAIEQGSLKLDPIEMTYEDARLSGHIHLDRNAATALDARLSLENVDLARFLEDFRYRDFYEGSFDMALEVSTQGGSLRRMASSLDGDLVIFISDASITGVDLQLRITDVLLGALPWLKREDDVVINCAMGEMAAENGVVDVRLLYLDSRQLRMMGGGTIDLRNETYDLRLSPRPRGTRIFAHNIDLLVTGPLKDPEYSTTGAARTVATKYGKYALLGPAGLLVPSGRSQKHPCIGSLQEYRDSQETREETQ